MGEKSSLQPSSSSAFPPTCCGKFDDDYFWNSVDEVVKKQTSNLLFEKNIYLDDERDCVLIIGLVPHERFSIGARIEKKGSKNVVHLDKDMLFHLIECVDDRFCENAVYPQSSRIVRIQLFDVKYYKICIGDDQRIKIPLAALLTLRQKQKVIKKHVHMLENNDYEKQLHKVLLHFCYDGDERMVLTAMQAPGHINKRQFTDEICMLDCNCVDRSFAVEMANSCVEWFLDCVPLFIKMLLLN